jgi:hypothetical protein
MKQILQLSSQFLKNLMYAEELIELSARDIALLNLAEMGCKCLMWEFVYSLQLC